MNLNQNSIKSQRDIYNPEKKTLRPRVDRIDDLNRLADQLKSTPTAIVNLCVDVGIEVLERSRNEMIKHFEAKLREKFK